MKLHPLVVCSLFTYSIAVCGDCSGGNAFVGKWVLNLADTRNYFHATVDDLGHNRIKLTDEAYEFDVLADGTDQKPPYGDETVSAKWQGDALRQIWKGKTWIEETVWTPSPDGQTSTLKGSSTNLESGKKEIKHQEYKRVSNGHGLFGKWELADSMPILKSNRVAQFITFQCSKPNELTEVGRFGRADQKDRPLGSWVLDGKERINDSGPLKATESASVVAPRIMEQTTRIKGKRWVSEWVLSPDGKILTALSPSDIDTDYPPAIDKASVWVYNRVQEFPKNWP